jgi:hypothetical protein
MNAAGEAGPFRKRSWAEALQLVVEFEQSGLRRKEFCSARGLSVHALDAWRRRAAPLLGVEKIVPVELVESCDSGREQMFSGSAEPLVQLRLVLSSGLRIEVERVFDREGLRRLIAALGTAALPGTWRERCKDVSGWGTVMRIYVATGATDMRKNV